MEGFQITLFSAILGVGFPLYKPYPHSLYKWGFLHFRYLKCLVIKLRNWAMNKTLVGFFDIGDEKLPSYMGILINHYKDPLVNKQYNGK